MSDEPQPYEWLVPEPPREPDLLPMPRLEETRAEISMPALSIYVEVVELLREFSGDEARLFEFVGKLKDLLR